MASKRGEQLERGVKLVGAAVALAGFVLAVAQFVVSRSIEAQKPYLEKKLTWCEEAAETAAAIATREPGQATEKQARFWELYWGVMGMVENVEVTNAMVAFGNGLQGKINDGATLRTLSLAIAHACRGELAKDWSPIWKR